jgi:hypothetical protein
MKVTYAAGELTLITLTSDLDMRVLGLNNLLSRANIKIAATNRINFWNGELTLPLNRTITLEAGVSPASFRVTALASNISAGIGPTMNTGAASGADIIPTGDVTLVATGSPTTFVSSDDTSNLTTTAATVKSFKAGDLVTGSSGFHVTFQAGAAQDGVISAASTFRDAL